MPEFDAKAIAEDFGIPPDGIKNIDPASPPPVRMMAAAGTLPVPPRVLMSMLYVLMGDPDRNVAATARKTLLGMPAPLLVKNIDPQTHPRILEFLAFHRTEEPLLEVIALRRQATDKTLCYLAENAPAMIIEIIAGNQERTLVTPEIVLHLEANPDCSPALVEKVRSWQRMNGIELTREEAEPAEEPAGEGAAEPAAETAAETAGGSIDEALLEDEPAPAGEASSGAAAAPPAGRPPLLQGDDPLLLLLTAMGIDLLPGYFEEDGGARPAAAAEPDADAVRRSQRDLIDVEQEGRRGEGLQPVVGMSFEFRLDRMDDDWDMSLLMDHGDDIDDDLRDGIAKAISKMTVGQKIKLAYVGNKQVREILIRDSNKMVNAAVIKSGRLTDPEVAKIASNRAVNEEVLRLIAQNKEWMRAYPVKVAMVNNPKCPVGTAMGFLNHLHPKDLKQLAGNRNVSSVIFTAARKKMKARSK